MKFCTGTMIALQFTARSRQAFDCIGQGSKNCSKYQAIILANIQSRIKDCRPTELRIEESNA